MDILGLGSGHELEKKLRYTEEVCTGVIFGKELVNAPANVLTPGQFFFCFPSSLPFLFYPLIDTLGLSYCFTWLVFNISASYICLLLLQEVKNIFPVANYVVFIYSTLDYTEGVSLMMSYTTGILAEEAKKIASLYSDVISAKILDVEQCKELKMGSYLGVPILVLLPQLLKILLILFIYVKSLQTAF